MGWGKVSAEVKTLNPISSTEKEKEGRKTDRQATPIPHRGLTNFSF